jgi:methylmalonyl-CoA epimerase
MGTIKKMDHVAIAVEDLEESVSRWVDALGMRPGQVEYLAQRKVRLCKLTAENSPALELISALDPDSPIAKFIAKNGEGIHHFCFEVDDIEAALAELKQAGMRLVHEQPVEGAGGSRIAFIHPESFNGVLIELAQKD